MIEFEVWLKEDGQYQLLKVCKSSHEAIQECISLGGTEVCQVERTTIYTHSK